MFFQYRNRLLTLIEAALKNNYISKSDLDTLNHWRKDPANWKTMLKIKSDLIIVNVDTKKCIEYLCDLNNYQFLLPKEKINNWQSNNNFAFSVFKRAYTLDIVKESSDNNQILLKSGVKSQFKFIIKNQKFRKGLQIVVPLK